MQPRRARRKTSGLATRFGWNRSNESIGPARARAPSLGTPPDDLPSRLAGEVGSGFGCATVSDARTKARAMGGGAQTLQGAFPTHCCGRRSQDVRAFRPHPALFDERESAGLPGPICSGPGVGCAGQARSPLVGGKTGGARTIGASWHARFSKKAALASAISSGDFETRCSVLGGPRRAFGIGRNMDPQR